ncbi:MAG TPA: hypothetical protein VHP81_02955, partial [Lachnospiraceae bacterium]|nr:hypothetical protein [Lachnospiraceae bacterium]
VSLVDIALISQYAENNFNGVNCGIMDQFAIAMGKYFFHVHNIVTWYHIMQVLLIIRTWVDIIHEIQINY